MDPDLVGSGSFWSKQHLSLFGQIRIRTFGNRYSSGSGPGSGNNLILEHVPDPILDLFLVDIAIRKKGCSNANSKRIATFRTVAIAKRDYEVA
jgi:hypothetical protein